MLDVVDEIMGDDSVEVVLCLSSSRECHRAAAPCLHQKACGSGGAPRRRWSKPLCGKGVEAPNDFGAVGVIAKDHAAFHSSHHHVVEHVGRKFRTKCGSAPRGAWRGRAAEGLIQGDLDCNVPNDDTAGRTQRGVASTPRFHLPVGAATATARPSATSGISCSEVHVNKNVMYRTTTKIRPCAGLRVCARF